MTVCIYLGRGGGGGASRMYVTRNGGSGRRNKYATM